MNAFWKPLGCHFVCSRCKSIHENLDVVLTTKYIYVEKLHDIYTSHCLQICEEECEVICKTDNQHSIWIYIN